MMKKLLLILVSAFLIFGFASVVKAQGIDNPEGVPLYVIIEVNWNGTGEGDWKVWGPVWEPVVGTGTTLSECTSCLDMNYDFVFKGHTVQFDEIMVPTVVGTPQAKHVVLRDDGTGTNTYVGSEAAEHYFPWVEGSAILYFDRIDYEIQFNEDNDVKSFHYLQYEHKKLPVSE
jgi:hypothetical protein